MQCNGRSTVRDAIFSYLHRNGAIGLDELATLDFVPSQGSQQTEMSIRFTLTPTQDLSLSALNVSEDNAVGKEEDALLLETYRPTYTTQMPIADRGPEISSWGQTFDPDASLLQAIAALQIGTPSTNNDTPCGELDGADGDISTQAVLLGLNEPTFPSTTNRTPAM